jgi:hypothetical protein
MPADVAKKHVSGKILTQVVKLQHKIPPFINRKRRV